MRRLGVFGLRWHRLFGRLGLLPQLVVAAEQVVEQPLAFAPDRQGVHGVTLIT